ncbi:unnamed protein product, partial [Medioppia subpectinata]
FICDFKECNKSFSTKSNLVQHKSCVHLNKRKFKCNEENCGKKFQTKQCLIHHKRIHSGEKPFVCYFNDCKKYFRTKYELTIHMRRHLNIKLHKCIHNNCNQRYKRWAHLNRHKNSIHSNVRFICDFNECHKNMSGEYGNEPQNPEDVDWGWGQRSKQRTPSVSQPTERAWLPISPPTSPVEWEQPGHTRRPLSPGGAVPVMTDQSPYTRPPADNAIYPGALEHINRLHRQYAEAPRGYEPTHALPDHTLSGEVHVSSGDEHSGWLGGLVPTRTGAAVLRRKTERDVAKLYDLGFDLRVDPSGQIGETG